MADKDIQFDGINIHRKGEDVSYGVCIIPGKTRPSLFKKVNNTILSIASFSKPENAVEFTSFLERLVNDVNKSRLRPSERTSTNTQ